MIKLDCVKRETWKSVRDLVWNEIWNSGWFKVWDTGWHSFGKVDWDCGWPPIRSLVCLQLENTMGIK